MHHFKRLHLLGLLLVLLAVWPWRPATSRATSATPTVHCGGWSLVKSPNPDSQYDELRAVAAVSASDVWAVGWGESPSSDLHTLIEHYDGASWQVVQSPSAGGSILFGVAAVSASDVWAVGYGQDEQQPLIEQWDGTKWRIVASPNPGDSYVQLEAVSAVSASDVWAVGYDTQGTTQQTLIEHFDGTRWSVVTSPNVKSGSNFLSGVAALSSTDVWAVGWVQGQRSYPLSEHWDGMKWKVVPVPYHTTPSGLFGVTALSSTDVWAVGSTGGPVYFSWHWNGQHWQKVPVHQSQYGSAQAVAASSPDNVWSVGTKTAGFNILTQAAHWDGKQWTLVPPRNHSGTPNGLTGVVMTSAQTVWAVGSSGQYGYSLQTLIEYYC